MKSGLYSITNTITRCVYIGSSVNVPKRLTRHRWELNNKRHKNQKLQRAWDKHGEAVFVFEKILTCPVELIRCFEQLFVNAYDSVATGYNILPDVNCSKGYKLSQEAKDKISQLHKGRVLSEEHRAKLRAAKIGTKFSDTHRQNMSKARKRYCQARKA
jgi:group I intron endonuclease